MSGKGGLFSLFVNGLAREIKAVGKGVQVGRQKVQLLLYADDIVLISDTQKDLQTCRACWIVSLSIAENGDLE